jgi:hypothetical protein
MTHLSVKNWEQFQHYKDRSPPWIKLHRDLLRDYDFACLQDASKLHLVLMWLLASQLDNKIPNDAAWITHQLGLSEPVKLKPLLDKGFIFMVQDASKTLADCKQSAIGETETEAYKEETERENAPRKRVAATGTRIPENWVPSSALQAWAVAERPGIDVQKVLDSFTDYWRGCAGAKGRKVDWDATFRNWVRRENGTTARYGTGSGTVRESATERSERIENEALEACGFSVQRSATRTRGRTVEEGPAPLGAILGAGTG